MILGERCVNMPLHSVADNGPMAVYENANQVDLFLGITVNNICVAYGAFATGLVAWRGTFYMLFGNDGMLAAFFGFLSANGQTPGINGSRVDYGKPEIFAIIVAGGRCMSDSPGRQADEVSVC